MSKLRFSFFILVLLVVGCTPTPGPTPTLTVDPGTPTASVTPPVSPISPPATPTLPPATATVVPPTATLPPTATGTALPPTATAIPVTPTVVSPLPTPVSPLPTPVSPLPTPVSPLLPQSGEPTTPSVELSGAGLAAVVALLTSFLLAYVPGFQAWWENYPHKREALAGVGFLLSWALVGLHYAGGIDLGLGAFGWPVVWQVLEAWLAFAGMGQLSFTAQQWGKTTDSGNRR